MSVIKRIKDAITGKARVSDRRSSKWPSVRAAYLERNPACAACGGTKKLEVHHIVPFHVDPSLELSESNLVTLCESWRNGMNCHLLVGHKGSYRRWNKRVLAHTKITMLFLFGRDKK